MLIKLMLIFVFLTNHSAFYENERNPKYLVKHYLVESLFCAEKNNWVKSNDYLFRIKNQSKVNLKHIYPLLNTSNNQFKSSVVELLGSLNKKKCTKELLKLLEKEENIEVKLSIIGALGNIKDKKSVGILKKYLYHEVWALRAVSANALGQITGKKYKIKKQILR